MKVKALIATLLFSAGATATFAQTNVDSLCKVNSSISHEAVRAGNFKDAYLPWQEVIKDCPTLRFYTYTDGFKILKAFMDEDNKANNNQRSSADYKKYFDELMATHDRRIEYIPEFQKTIKVLSVDEALGIKAIDYLAYAPGIDVDLVYGWLKQSANSVKGESQGAVLHYFVEMSMNKLKKDDSHKEQFIQDYLDASEYVDAALAAAQKESDKKNYSLVKENLLALFVNSGAADCTSLQGIYGPKVEENKSDLAYLKKVIDIMKGLGCIEEEAYFQASYYSYLIEPSADAAAGNANMSFKKGDIDEAVKFLDEAINLEQDDAKKAELAYRAAYMLFTQKKLSQARTYAVRATQLNPNYGAPHILIATLYATSPNWSEESALNKCTYFVILDRLQRAKSVDPSMTEEANKLINTYSKYTPSAQDLFMLGYKKGDKVTVGGWIGETTTIR